MLVQRRTCSCDRCVMRCSASAAGRARESRPWPSQRADHDNPSRAPVPRLLPYDLAFVESQFEQPICGSSGKTLKSSARTARIRPRFLQLRSVAALLRGALVESDASVVAQYGPLLFQAYHFWLQANRYSTSLKQRCAVCWSGRNLRTIGAGRRRHPLGVPGTPAQSSLGAHRR